MSRIALSLLALSVSTPFAAAQVELQSSQHDVLPLADVAAVTFLAPDMAAVEAEDAARAAAGLPYRFAIPNDVSITRP